jgi:hypothetical protein
MSDEAMKIRIRDDLEMETLFTWPNPKPPRPLKRTRAEECRLANEKLEKDVRRWVARARWAGL